jgi:alpha-1,2-mannosyltransferase
VVVVSSAVVAGIAARWWGYVDLAVYRFGGQGVLDHHPVYDAAAPGSGLLFTYPPFAALVMAVLAVPPFWLAAAAWTAVGVAALAVTLLVFGRELGTPPGPRALAVLTAGALVLDPVRETLQFGQVNLLLMALVTCDLLVLRGRATGVLIGVAAGIKLTPLLFVVFLVLVGRRAAALRAVSVFAATVLAGVVLLPGDAAAYWGRALWDTDRVGGVEYVRNQSLLGTLTRLGHQEPSAVLWVLVAAPVGLAVLHVAAAWWRRGRREVAVLLAAGAVLLCSPISWDHHWVWTAPLLLVLWRRAPRWVSAVTAALVLLGLRAIVEHGAGSELGWHPAQQLPGNGYAWLALLLSGAAGYTLRAGSIRPATSPSVTRPPSVLGAE